MSNLNRTDSLILLALRAGEMDRSQLYERFGGNTCELLIALGYVERFGDSSYRITDAGRKACPSRREIDRVKPLSKEKKLINEDAKNKQEMVYAYLQQQAEPVRMVSLGKLFDIARINPVIQSLIAKGLVEKSALGHKQVFVKAVAR